MICHSSRLLFSSFVSSLFVIIERAIDLPNDSQLTVKFIPLAKFFQVSPT